MSWNRFRTTSSRSLTLFTWTLSVTFIRRRERSHEIGTPTSPTVWPDLPTTATQSGELTGAVSCLLPRTGRMDRLHGPDWATGTPPRTTSPCPAARTVFRPLTGSC